MSFDEGVDVGYRYFQTHGERPLFPFGYGLSYTTFSQRIVQASMTRGGDVTLEVAATNRGRVPGADVVEGYVHDPSSTGEPPEQLRAFGKVFLWPHQTRIVRLVLHPSAFAFWSSGAATGTQPETTSPTAPSATRSPQPDGQWTVAPGTYRVGIGDSVNDISDSVSLHLSGASGGSGLDGLFGWPLGR